MHPRRVRSSGTSWGLLGICLGYFMVILDATVVNVALPALARGLHGGVSTLQWTVDGYTLAFAGRLLSGGAIAERLGGRTAFHLGLAVFALSSVAAGSATTMWMMVLARLIQGFGAALLVPASLVLLQAAYPSRQQRSRAWGTWGAVAGIAAAAGPVVGGLVVVELSWRAVFFINVPFAFLAAVLAVRFVPSSERHRRSLDLPGQLTGAMALAILAAALVEAGSLGWDDPLVAGGILSSAVLLAVFVRFELRAADPMLPLALFRCRQFLAGSSVGLLINFGFYGQLFVMSLYLQDVRRYSALLTGLALLPEAALLTVASMTSGRLLARKGPRWPMVLGLTIGCVGLVGLAVTSPHSRYGLLIVPMAASGFGMALVMPAVTSSVMEAAPADRGGIASGVINSARQCGGVLGVAVLGTLVRSHATFTTGMRYGLVLGALAFLIGVALTWTGIESPPRRP